MLQTDIARQAAEAASKHHYTVRFAGTRSEIREAQKLRYRVFKEEFGAHLSTTEPDVDQDFYDDYCEHLIVRDEAQGRIVGTYRVLAPERAQQVGSYYAENEFFLTRLEHLRPRIVEVGRSCIDADYRAAADQGLSARRRLGLRRTGLGPGLQQRRPAVAAADEQPRPTLPQALRRPRGTGAGVDLILWRHADAKDARPGMADTARELSPRGLHQADEMADWLRGQPLREPRVLVSPTERARQTAQAFRLPFKIDRRLGIGATAADLLAAADWPDCRGTVILVGHQPSLGRLNSRDPFGETSARRVRAIFISDVHLGSRGCQAESLLDFLRVHEAEYLYLVGDIVDFWAMNRGIHWLLVRVNACGHIHSAAIKEVDGLTYINCGDWVDSCTAILEHLDGRLELVEWRLAPTRGAKATAAAIQAS